MRTKRLVFWVALLWLAACDGSDPTDPGGEPGPAVDRVEIDPQQTSLLVGDTVRLTAQAYTAGGEPLSGMAVSWTNRTPGLATLAGEGSTVRLTATGEGTALVSAAVGGKTGEASITISLTPLPEPGPVTSVEIDVDSLALDEGDGVQLTAIARDADGRIVTGRFVFWTSGDPEVAPIGALGEVTAVRAGRTAITARVEAISTSIPVRVQADYPYELVYAGWDGSDVGSARLYGTDLGDIERSSVRIGPDGPSSAPVPSHDGTRVAYVLLLDGGARSLMVANRDGSGAVELLRTADVGCGRMTWSPDDRRLAFGCRIGDGDPDIWAVDADGQNLVNLTDAHPGKQEWPSWSPVLPNNTSRIAYAQYVDNVPQIWTMNADGTDPRQVTAGMDWEPAWSPDGGTIAFRRILTANATGIWLVNAAGGSERELVGSHLAGSQESPAWSPDGRFVAFVSTHETYGSGEPLVRHIYTVWADGTKLARRTRDGLDAYVPAWRTR